MHAHSTHKLSLAFVVALLSATANAITVNTPGSLTQCQPILLSWSDGTAPFYPAILPGGQPSATPLRQLGAQQGNSVTWTVDLAPGEQVTIAVTDGTGEIAYTAPVSINAGSSTACMSGGSNNVAASSGGGAAPVVSSPVVSPTGPARISSSAAGPVVVSSPSAPVINNAVSSPPVVAAASTSATTPSSGASRLVLSSGLLGALGLAAFALL